MTEFSPQEWNIFVSSRGGSFLQSWEWGMFQEKTGKKVHRVAVPGLVGQCMEQTLPFGAKYWYVPRGPVGDAEKFSEWLAAVKAIAGNRKGVFLRIDPPPSLSHSSFVTRHFADIGRSLQPRKNLIMDLQKSEDELLAAMHEKTRYNIRLAGRHVVSVRIADSHLTPVFWELLSETAHEQGLQLYPKEYYQTMLEHFGSFANSKPEPEARGTLFVAEYDNKALAAVFLIEFGNRITYVHGGSSRNHKNVMAPHLLHWEVMQWAKTQGFLEYDMGGIDEVRWPGLTRFKTGFGGRIEEFPNAYELAFDKIKYVAYRLGRRLLK